MYIHMNKENNLLQGNITQQLLLFFFPIMFGSIFQQLYNTVDAIVVGNYVGKEALGAVGGSTGTIMQLLTGFMIGLSTGATVVIAQYYGKRDESGVNKGVNAGIFIALVLGLFLCVGTIYNAPVILHAMKVPDAVYDYSVLYLRICMLGLIPTAIYNTGAGVLRAVGDSKRPLYFLIVSCVMNIFLDILFVVVFKLGVMGVASATLLSQITSCLCTLFVLCTAKDIYRFDIRKFSVDLSILKRIVTIGIPSGIQTCFYAIANLVIQTSINTYGTDTVAAWTAFNKIDTLYWNSSGALGTAVLTFAGQNYGAGKIDRVKKGVTTALIIYNIGTIAITAICWFGSSFLLQLFTSDKEVIRIGVQMTKFLSVFWITFSFTEIYTSTMRACGDSIRPMIITACSIAILRIIWIVVYPAKTIIDTLMCYPLSWIVASILFIFYYRSGVWLKHEN